MVGIMYTSHNKKINIKKEKKEKLMFLSEISISLKRFSI